MLFAAVDDGQIKTRSIAGTDGLSGSRRVR